MNILITGGAGFIGSNLSDFLLNDASSITIIDNLSTGSVNNISKSSKVSFVEADITDYATMSKIFEENSFDFIYHLAAVASVQDSIINPVLTHSINFDATLNLLELARKSKSLKRFIFASSAAVYGNNPFLPSKETDAVNPISPYGVDKYAAERYVINHGNLYNIPVTAFRFFNIFGPRQNPSSPYSGVISIFQKAFKDPKPFITLFGDGKQTRDFLFVNDLVKILTSAANKEETIGQVINGATNQETNLLNIISYLENISGKKAEISFKPEREGDIKRSFGNNEKIKRFNLIDSYTSVEEGLQKLLNA